MKYVVDVLGELPTHGSLSKASPLRLNEVIEDIASQMCDKFCKYPDICENDEELFAHCEQCPFGA